MPVDREDAAGSLQLAQQPRKLVYAGSQKREKDADGVVAVLLRPDRRHVHFLLRDDAADVPQQPHAVPRLDDLPGIEPQSILAQALPARLEKDGKDIVCFRA